MVFASHNTMPTKIALPTMFSSNTKHNKDEQQKL
jgi:hypothetical protein